MSGAQLKLDWMTVKEAVLQAETQGNGELASAPQRTREHQELGQDSEV